MRKLFSLVLITLLVLTISSCSLSKSKLYLLNWDEYINEELLERFEEEFDCKVIMEIAESNEIMYQRIDTNSADYDIAFPSDYMISQMKENDMLLEIDFDKIENYDEELFVSSLMELIDRDCADIKPYLVPYFWGSLGIMYNTDLMAEEEFEERISALREEGLNAWNILFDKELEDQIGMYATSRDSIACALMSLGYSVNETDPDKLKEAEAKLKSMNYKAWSTDDLKVGVAGGKYTLALVYSGDYIDALYSIEDPTEANFKMYAPNYVDDTVKDINNVFFDAMVIPKTSKNTELAYEFINFMISQEDSEDEDSNAFLNADAVGYCPTLADVLYLFEDEYAEDYEGVTDQDAYNPSDITVGEVYQYLGADVYDQYEQIYKRVKSNTDEDEANTSGYILLGVVGVIIIFAGSVAAANSYKKQNKAKKEEQ